MLNRYSEAIVYSNGDLSHCSVDLFVAELCAFIDKHYAVMLDDKKSLRAFI